MLAAMREALLGSNETHPKFNFEWTYFWDEFVRRFEAGHENPGASPQQFVIEELRLEGPEAYARVEAMALLRRVAVSGAAPVTPSPAPDSLRTTLTDIRARLGLFTRADLDRWMARNDLDVVSMERLIADQAGFAILRDRSSAALEPYILDELRLSGAYERLVERARRKSDALAGRARAPSASQTLALRLWYFEHRLRRPLPDDVEDFARRLRLCGRRRLRCGAASRASLSQRAGGRSKRLTSAKICSLLNILFR